MNERLESFRRAIAQLPGTDRERAKRLGVGLRTLTEYKAGRFPRIIRALAEHPDLARSLAGDLQTQRSTPESAAEAPERAI